MAKIRQYRPAFFDGFENQTVEFNSIEELIKIDWVDGCTKEIGGKYDKKFHQFSICKERGDTESTLMAEYNDGFTWWVVGFIDDEEIIKNMPTWVAKYK
jgi:hypothetical protein